MMKQRKMIIAAFFTALLCVSSYMIVPIGPVPQSMQPAFVFLTGLILGMRWGAISVLVWFAIGILGLPVFAGGKAGIITFIGPTGGFLVGFLLCVLIVGYFADQGLHSIAQTMGSLIVGIVVLYAVGIVGFKLSMQYVFDKNLSYLACFNILVIPFLPFDLIKALLAAYVGQKMRRALVYIEK